MYTEIKTVEEALKRQKDPIDLPSIKTALAGLPARMSRGMVALLTLQAVTEVVNNDDPNEPEWKADYNDEDQEKWNLGTQVIELSFQTKKLSTNSATQRDYF